MGSCFGVTPRTDKTLEALCVGQRVNYKMEYSQHDT